MLKLTMIVPAALPRRRWSTTFVQLVNAELVERPLLDWGLYDYDETGRVRVLVTPPPQVPS